MILSSKRRPARGFTLMELMVTMAVLSVILVLALQVTESSRNAIRTSEGLSVNDAIARRAFDQIARDISQMIVREDARIGFKSQSGNDKLAFLTHARGLTGIEAVGERSVSLVSYELSRDTALGEQFVRGSRGHQFDDGAADSLSLDPTQPFPAIAPDNLQPVSNNIIRFEVEYLIQGPTGITREITPPDTTENLRGLVVSLVTLDDRGRKAIRPAGIPDLAEKFTDATSSKNTLETWSKTRDDLTKSGYPGVSRDVLQSIRCYQRTVLTP